MYNSISENRETDSELEKPQKALIWIFRLGKVLKTLEIVARSSK